MENVTINNL